MTFASSIRLLAASEGTPNIVIYLSALGGLLGVVGTIYGVWSTAKSKRRSDDLAQRNQDLLDKQQVLQERSVTFDQMNDAMPGLGELVKLYQGQARDAITENIELRRQQLEDHKRIIELEGQVRAVTTELLTLRRKNESQAREIREQGKALERQESQIKQLKRELGQ